MQTTLLDAKCQERYLDRDHLFVKINMGRVFVNYKMHDPFFKQITAF